MRCLALALLLALAACDTSPQVDTIETDGLTQDADLLVGTWRLARVHPYWGGEKGAQPYTGPAVLLSFRTDSTYTQLTAGIDTLEGRYEVEGGVLYSAREWGRSSWGGWGVDSDRFVTDIRYLDGDQSEYLRQ